MRLVNGRFYSFFPVFLNMLMFGIRPACCEEAQVAIGKTRCPCPADSQDQPQASESASPQLIAVPSCSVSPAFESSYLMLHRTCDCGKMPFGVVC